MDKRDMCTLNTLYTGVAVLDEYTVYWNTSYWSPVGPPVKVQ